jgi:hypothetical protein
MLRTILPKPSLLASIHKFSRFLRPSRDVNGGIFDVIDTDLEHLRYSPLTVALVAATMRCG